MKPHEVINAWKGDKRFGEMARRAAALKKAGQSAEQIVRAITAEFGPPPQLATLRDAPRPFTVYGEVGADIEPGAVAQLELAMRLPVAERGALAEGVAVDEAPQAYKDVERVIELQVAAGLITPIARMRPVAVIMAGEKGED